MATKSTIRQDLGHIERDPSSIRSIKHPTKDEMLLAVDLDPFTIQYFEDQADEEIRDRALQNDPRVIQYFKNPTINEQKFVIYNLMDWKKYLKAPDDELEDFRIEAWLQRHPMIL